MNGRIRTLQPANAAAPPERNPQHTTLPDIERIRRMATALASILACTLLALAALASPAFADTTLHQDGFSDVPAQKIIFDNLHIGSAEVTSSNANISVSNCKIQGQEYQRDSVVIHVTEGQSTRVNNPFSIRFNDAGYDASGDRVDLIMTCDELVLQPYSNGSVIAGDYTLLRDTSESGQIGIFAWSVSGQANKLGIAQTYSIQVVKTGTNESTGYPLLMYMCDIDAKDLTKTTSTTSTYNGEYAESIQLLNGYEADTYITADSTLKASEGNTRFRGSAADENTDRSAVVFTLDSDSSQIRWTGSKCGTRIFQSFTRTITATADEGGSIDPTGASSVLWRNDASYAITPAEHYQIQDVLVDGISVGVLESYLFQDVTADHTIHASFEPCRYTLSFDLNGQEGTPPDSQELEYESLATEPDDPTAEHHTFGGWYLEPEGTTAWDFATNTMPENDVVLYAQWIPEQLTVRFVDGHDDTDIDEQTVDYGDDANDPGAPEHDGYVFTGWDKSFTNVTEDLVVTAEYRPAAYVIAYDANEGEGEMADQDMEYDVAANLSANAFTRTGYTFTGWNTAADSSGDAYTDEQEVINLTAEDGATVTLYAQWTAIPVDEEDEPADTGDDDTATPAKSSNTGTGESSTGTYAKTGNPFIDGGWALMAAGATGVIALVIGIRILWSRRRGL